MIEPAIKSPCIKVCAVEGQTGWCLGCARTLKEIAGWAGMTRDQQAAVIDLLPSRIETLEREGRR